MRFADGIFEVDDAHCGWDKVLLVGAYSNTGK
jgi:hypothetical protein